MKKKNLLSLSLALLISMSANHVCAELTPIYERTDLELNGTLNASESNAEAVPAAEASQILNADALTIAIDYSINPEDFANKSPMPFVAASASSQAWLFGSLQAHNQYGLCYSYKANIFSGAVVPNNSAAYSTAGYNQKVVFVINSSKLIIYLNNNEVVSESGNFTFKSKVNGIANQLYIGALKNGDEVNFTDTFKGTIHSIRFFTEALSADQVKELFNNSGAIEGVDADNKDIYYADGVVYNQAGEIAIYDVNGKLIVRTSEALVDVCDLANGVYIVRGAENVVKFVK